MILVAAGLSLLAWATLLTLHGRFWSAGPILPATPTQPTAAVTIVIPARNEADTIAAVLRSQLGQTYAGPLHLILVDDRSTDATAAIAKTIADPRLTVVAGAPRPPGWSGKLWAVHQGVALARTELILLCDADIVHAPGHLSALVAQLTANTLDLASEMVALRCQSPAERWLVPAFVFFFQLLYPFARVNDPAHRTAAAAGGTMLLRAQALARIGGIPALRGALIDDVTLAQRIKASGGRIWLGHSPGADGVGKGGGGATSLRPYPHAADVWRMVSRTAFVQLRHSFALLALTTGGMALVWLVPCAAALFGHGPVRWLGLIAWTLSGFSFLPTLHRFRLGWWRAAFLPAIASFYMAATIDSALNHVRGRGVVWKGRAYTEAPGR